MVDCSLSCCRLRAQSRSEAEADNEQRDKVELRGLVARTPWVTTAGGQRQFNQYKKKLLSQSVSASDKNVLQTKKQFTFFLVLICDGFGRLDPWSVEL